MQSSIVIIGSHIITYRLEVSKSAIMGVAGCGDVSHCSNEIAGAGENVVGPNVITNKLVQGVYRGIPGQRDVPSKVCADACQIWCAHLSTTCNSSTKKEYKGDYIFQPVQAHKVHKKRRQHTGITLIKPT